jgi:hypothetical protein
MKAKALDRLCLIRWDGHGWLDGWGLTQPIKREPERFAEGGQGTLGGIGFRGLEGGVVYFTG